MSGTNIPMMGVAPDIAGQAGKLNQNLLTAAQVPQVQAQTGQTIAQTGLIGQQTRAADIQNQIAGARLPFLMNAYGQGGGGQGANAPPGAGGPPGAIGATGDQNWTGPGGQIMDPNGPFGQLGALPHGVATELMLSPSEQWVTKAPEVYAQKKAYIAQQAAATLDPNTGQADPDKWNQMLNDEIQSGWLDAKNARPLFNHPEFAQNLISSTLPAGEMPGTKQATAAATAAGTATQELTKINVPVLDANGQPTGQTQEQYFRKSDLTAGGQPKPGAQNAAYGPPVQATELPPVAQNFLRALSPSEANSPNQRYVSPGSGRPATFDTSQGHPGQGAAGLFQFEPETWARGAQLADVDPKDMSQANQERVAWAVAQDDYANNSGGKSLTYDLNHGNYGQVAQGLKTTWPSITGGSQQNAIGQSFVSRLAAIQGGGQPAAGGTAAPAGAGTAGGGGTTPAAAGSVGAAGPPTITPLATEQLKMQQPRIAADTKTIEDTQSKVQSLQNGQSQLLNIRALSGKIDAGALGDQRAALNNYFASFGPDWAKRAAAEIPGLDPSKAGNQQEFVKQTLQQAGNAERDTLGSRGGFQAISLYQRAFPNINMQPTAIKDMSNLLLIAHQRDLDYSNGQIGQFNNEYQQAQANPTTHAYQPLSTYDEKTWGVNDPNSIHAAPVYVAAAALMNGHTPGDAFKWLTQDQQVEALHIIHRTDPTATVGGMRPPTAQ